MGAGILRTGFLLGKIHGLVLSIEHLHSHFMDNRDGFARIY
jgi:hypothetical protein